jgi:hypothetical protein
MQIKLFTLIRATLNIGILLLAYSCQSAQQAIEKDKQLERQIITKIRQDKPYLAQLEAIYSVNYVNYVDRKVLGVRIPFLNDDVYARSDTASVFYGYALADVDIVIATENDQRILRVKLPQPSQISIDRLVNSPIIVNNEAYVPIDEQGKKVDVDQYIYARVTEAITQYEQKNLNMTRDMTRQYFQAIAERFNLKLQLEFDNARTKN